MKIKLKVNNELDLSIMMDMFDTEARQDYEDGLYHCAYTTAGYVIQLHNKRPHVNPTTYESAVRLRRKIEDKLGPMMHDD